MRPQRARRRHIVVGSEDEEHKQVVRFLKLANVDFKSDHEAGRKRNVWEQQRIKSMQSGRGWADIFVAEPRGVYHGAFIELKRVGVKLLREKPTTKILQGDYKIRLRGDWWDVHTEEQAAFLERMRKKGYYAEFAIGAEQAILKLKSYLQKQ